MHKCTLHIYVYTHIAYLSISIYTYRERDVYTCIRHTYMYMCIIYREREIHTCIHVCMRRAAMARRERLREEGGLQDVQGEALILYNII